MEETQKVFEPVPFGERDKTIVNEPDVTLATPRFDEVETQVARPVEPLPARPVHRGGRRQWPIALVLISALAGGVVSILAFRLYQQRQQQQTQVSAAEVQGGAPETVAATESPAPAREAAPDEQAQADAPVVFEEFDPAKEGDRATDAASSRPKATVTEAAAAAPPARKDEAEDEPKDNSKPNARLVETIRPPRTQSAPRQIEARHNEDVLRREDERAVEDDFYERRRERRRQRREQRREQRRNIDRIKDIFEGTPPG